MEETWKPIKDFEELYLISTQGRVKGLKSGKILKQNLSNRGGYFQLQLTKESKGYQRTVHRLVAETFIPNPKNKKQVNHIDGVKTNNHLTNLEWCTSKENMSHANSLQLLNVPKPNGSKHHLKNTYASKKVIHKPSEVIYNSLKEAAEQRHLSYNKLRRVITGKTKKSLETDFSYL